MKTKVPLAGESWVSAATHYKGFDQRSLAWTSDIGPHWVPDAFANWDGFGKLWINALSWLTGAA